MTRRDAAWLHRPDDEDNIDSHAVSEYRGELRDSSGKRLNWFTVTSVLVLLIWLFASLHGVGCLGGK
jgi:hypothetical protein